jgi:hypothetical protein
MEGVMSGRAFVVERINWGLADRDGRWAHLPGAVRVACFEDAATAEADCRRREAEARSKVNPFLFGGPALHYQTSLDEGRLRDWLLDAGLEPPVPEGGPWQAWWEERAPAMTDVHKLQVWNALDKVRFFRVVEGSARVVFVVVKVHWAYNDENFYRSADSVAPVRAFTCREKAQELCRQRERKARAAANPFEMNACGGPWEAWTSTPQQEFRQRVVALGLAPPEEEYEWSGWWEGTRMSAAQRQGVWDLIDKTAFYEVAEVELPG